MSKRHSWKKNPNHFLSLDFFFQKWRLLISRKIFFSKIHDHISRKKVWIFFPEMTLTHFPKSDFWNFGWIFFSKNESTVESRRSKRTKADDPQKDESRRSGAKADDLWFKADDLLSQSRRSMGLSRRSWAKAEISGAQSRRSYLKSHSVKADDLKGRKQTILWAKTHDPT